MDRLGLLPEEGLLLWLKVYPFRDLGEMTPGELKKALAGLRPDVLALAEAEPVEVRTEPIQAEFKTGILDWFVAPHLDVAFVHPLDPVRSSWILGHDQGRQHLERKLGRYVTTRSYFHADSPEQAEKLLEQAVEEGAQIVFTTTPQLSRATLKAAVKYPFTEPMLIKLREMGLKIGIITNGSVQSQQTKIDLLGINEFVDETVICGTLGAQKPDTLPFDVMCEKLGINANELLYVGDNPINDIMASRNAGYIPVWVKTLGTWDFDDIERSEYEVDTVAEIPELVDRINKGTV
jgi:FMN phosphatase YigB (HAD superfamily)